jgi:hypothetical protein
VQKLARANKDLSGQLDTARKRAEQADTYEAELGTARARHASEAAMLGSGLPSLADPEIRDFVRERYDAYTRTAGDKATEFGAWLDAQRAKPSPLLAPYLAPPPAAEPPPAPAATPVPAAAQGQRAPAVPPPAPAPAAGQPPPAAATGITPQQVQAAASNPASWRQQKAAIKADLEARYGTSIGSDKK